MKPYLKTEEITREIKEKLPVSDEETFREHYCSECLYYAGRIDKKPHCMQRQCSWDQEEEHFAPVLRKMIPILDEECRQRRGILMPNAEETPFKRCSQRRFAWNAEKKIHVTNVRIIVMLHASDFAISR